MTHRTDEELKHLTDEAEAWLDQLDPATVEARDASEIRDITAIVDRIEADQAELRAAVGRARDAGHSWTLIGAALKVTRQAARERFSAAQSVR